MSGIVSKVVRSKASNSRTNRDTLLEQSFKLKSRSRSDALAVWLPAQQRLPLLPPLVRLTVQQVVVVVFKCNVKIPG